MKAERGGFTLIEMLIALGVVAVGLGSLIGLLPAAMQFSRENRDLQRSRVFADSLFDAVEMLRRRDDLALAPPTVELPSVLGLHPVSLDGSKHAWPEVNEQVPVVWYSGSWHPLQPGVAELRLELTPGLLGTGRVHRFQRAFPLEMQP